LKILAERLFGGGSEALLGRALPKIGKIRFGRCAGKVAFPHSSCMEIVPSQELQESLDQGRNK